MRTGVSSKIIVGTKITRTRGRGTRWRPRLSSYSATSRKCHAGRSACATGGWVGVLGGLIGLGGAEFRLPLLIGVFGFLAPQAVIMNKATSLIVVLTALPARPAAVPIDTLRSSRSGIGATPAASALVWRCPGASSKPWPRP
jgi:uncharacterized membrane protein YfcA